MQRILTAHDDFPGIVATCSAARGIFSRERPEDAAVDDVRAIISTLQPHADAPRFEIAINHTRAALRGGWWLGETHTLGQDLWGGAIDSYPQRRRDERGEMVFNVSLLEAAQFITAAMALPCWADTAEACPIIITRLSDGARVDARISALGEVSPTWVAESHCIDAEEIKPPRCLCDDIEPPIYERGIKALVSLRVRTPGSGPCGAPIFASDARTLRALDEQRLVLSLAGLLALDDPQTRIMARAFERAEVFEVAFRHALDTDDFDLI